MSAFLGPWPQDQVESMSAIAALLRILNHESALNTPAIRGAARLLMAKPPKWDDDAGTIDFYYWYYATLAMFQVGGDPWTKWNKAMDSAMVDTQRKDTDYCMYKGSWDNLDAWGGDGGRVYSTAVMAMCLEVYYRYEVVGTKTEER